MNETDQNSMPDTSLSFVIICFAEDLIVNFEILFVEIPEGSFQIVKHEFLQHIFFYRLSYTLKYLGIICIT